MARSVQLPGTIEIILDDKLSLIKTQNLQRANFLGPLNIQCQHLLIGFSYLGQLLRSVTELQLTIELRQW